MILLSNSIHTTKMMDKMTMTKLLLFLAGLVNIEAFMFPLSSGNAVSFFLIPLRSMFIQENHYLLDWIKVVYKIIHGKMKMKQ